MVANSSITEQAWTVEDGELSDAALDSLADLLVSAAEEEEQRNDGI